MFRRRLGVKKIICECFSIFTVWLTVIRLTVAPRTSRYMALALSRSGVTIATWFNRPSPQIDWMKFANNDKTEWNLSRKHFGCAHWPVCLRMLQQWNYFCSAVLWTGLGFVKTEKIGQDALLIVPLRRNLVRKLVLFRIKNTVLEERNKKYENLQNQNLRSAVHSSRWFTCDITIKSRTCSTPLDCDYFDRPSIDWLIDW